jgi:hypothetical protein
MTPEDLVELEAIKRLKYKYMRCLDQKRWEELATCFTEDATVAYSGGHYAIQGRDAIIEWLRGAMGSESFLSSHRAHHPEIDLTGPTTANGIWALEDTVVLADADFGLRGAAFYTDEYVKDAGEWKIASTGYKRTFEETYRRGDVPSLRLTASWWGTDGRSELEV